MSEYDELVKILRDGGWRGAEAADAIEALVGEVERLRGVLTTLSTETNISQEERKYHARSALEAKP